MVQRARVPEFTSSNSPVSPSGANRGGSLSCSNNDILEESVSTSVPWPRIWGEDSPMRQLLPAPRSWLRTTGWYGFVSCPSILLVISLNNGQEIWQVWRWDWSESLPVSAGVCQCLPAQAAECKRGWLIRSQKPVLGYLSLSILWWCWGNSFCSEAELPLTATLWNHVSLKGFLPPKLY